MSSEVPESSLQKYTHEFLHSGEFTFPLNIRNFPVFVAELLVTFNKYLGETNLFNVSQREDVEDIKTQLQEVTQLMGVLRSLSQLNAKMIDLIRWVDRMSTVDFPLDVFKQKMRNLFLGDVPFTKEKELEIIKERVGRLKNEAEASLDHFFGTFGYSWFQQPDQMVMDATLRFREDPNRFREEVEYYHYFFHDVINSLASFSMSVESLATFGDWDDSSLEELGLSFSEMVQPVQRGMIDTLILVRAFNMRERSPIKEQETVGNLSRYFQKRFKSEFPSSLPYSHQRIWWRDALVALQERRLPLAEKLRRVSLIQHLQVINETGLELEELNTDFNIPFLLRILINVTQNTKKAYIAQAERSFALLGEIEAPLRAELHVRSKGLHVLFEDDATGFPMEDEQRTYVSQIDRAECVEYPLEFRKSKWKGSVRGTGVGLFGIAKSLRELIPGAKMQVGTRTELVDSGKKNQHGRLEIFIPYS